MNAHQVARDFDSFLKREDLQGKRDAVDAVLVEYRGYRGGLIPVLQRVQEELNYLPPEVQDYIALGLGVPAADVFGVVSFYSFFSMKPKGKYIIKVCLGTACYVMGAMKIIDKISSELDVRMGDTTDDRKYTLQGVRCLGACGLAPVMMINEDTHGQVDYTKVNRILKKYE